MSTSSFNVLLSDRTPKAIKSKNSSKVQPATASKAPPSLTNNNNNNNNNASKESVSYNVLSDRTANNIKSPPSLGFLLSSPNTLLVSERTASTKLPSSNKASPLSNCNSNNDNNKVSIANKAPVTNKTTYKVNVLIPGMIHTGTTEYDTTSTRPNTSSAHEEASTAIIPIPGTIHTTKYGATENHVTGKWKFSLTRSKISLAHEEASTAIPEFLSTRSKISNTHESSQTGSKIVIPNVSKSSELSSTRSKISFAQEEASSRTPVTSRTTCKVNEVTHTMKSKIPGMIHTGTTKYAATENHVAEIPSTRSNILVTHESSQTGSIIVIPNVSKSSEFLSMRSKVSYAHEEASTAILEFSSMRPYISVTHEEASPATSKVLQSSKLSSTRPNISVAHEEVGIKVLKSCESSQTGSTILITHEETLELSSARPHISIAHGSNYKGNIDKYTTTENQASLNDKLRSKISITHEQPVLKIICRDKPPTVKFKINMVLNEGMNTKYTTAMEPSSYAPTPIINDNPVNNKSFRSQYLKTVLKITSKNNNNNGTFNNMLPLLLYQIIPIHHSIEYLQPEPEPPPLNSDILLFLFLFIGKTTKQKVVSFISELLYYFNNIHSLSLTLKNFNSKTLSYINIKTALTHHTWSSSSFSAPLTESKFLQIHTNQTLLTHTKTNIHLFIPEFRFCKCGEV
jgi:hypothetical protein